MLRNNIRSTICILRRSAILRLLTLVHMTLDENPSELRCLQFRARQAGVSPDCRLMSPHRHRKNVQFRLHGEKLRAPVLTMVFLKLIKENAYLFR